ncbi:MAG: phosphate acyltransferase PlsX [Myxococcota bacterium]|nr:phosphate acyltransferase PlsX [Myxococcota bacterium]
MKTNTPFIALDAMGGDHAPGPMVAGALDAVRLDGRAVVLFGRRESLEPLLKGVDYPRDRLRVVHCPDLVAMNAKPSAAMRQSESSMARCFRAVKEGDAVAGVSAGNSGATMALALRYLGRIKGVTRPAICLTMPGKGGPRLLLDGGANTTCTGEMLTQFALMADCYAKAAFGLTSPRIAVLSNGEEEGKGTELTKEAYERIQETSVNFVGYCEGRDLFTDALDVIVTDGFTGNVALKTLEGTARFIVGQLKVEIEGSLLAMAGAMLAKGAFDALKGTLDPSQYGGAPLLGLNAPAIIAHGSSDALAVRSALRVASRCAAQDLTVQIESALSQLTA